MTVKFTLINAQRSLVHKIVARGVKLCKEQKVPYDKLSMTMDITATIANGNPMRLQQWLEADDFNFAHDLFGIRRYIDRDTGKLTDCFIPRFTAHAPRLAPEHGVAQ